MTIECKRCQKEFEPSPRFKNYCSDECKAPTTFSAEDRERRRQQNFNFIRSQGRIPFHEQEFECKLCKSIFKPKTSSHGRTFCSRSCSSKHRFITDEARHKQSMLAKKLAFAQGKTGITKCSSCKCEFRKKQQKQKYCAECKPFALYVSLFSKLELDTSISLKDRAILAKERLSDMYYVQRMSMLYMQNELKINMNTFHRFAKKVGLKLKTISEGILDGYKEGRMTIGANHPSFKQGWHTTWEGKEFYYRSSYEYDVCNELDAQRIPYEMEALRIPYYDSQKQQTRTALPDFHIASSNEIWEVKSLYFFNKVNMQDKFREYRRLGYVCKLVLEHKEYDYEAVMSM